MIVLNSKRGTDGRRTINVSQLPIFKRVVKDIKEYVGRVKHFDRNYISVCFLFCKEIMPYVDTDLMKDLIMRTVESFD